ncbi:hypothetical protein A2U01_0060910, partial [Trifolium medium]|nr:hypothetical protein [Trifolium medium]
KLWPTRGAATCACGAIPFVLFGFIAGACAGRRCSCAERNP